jgi:hypothetical protein
VGVEGGGVRGGTNGPVEVPRESRWVVGRGDARRAPEAGQAGRRAIDRGRCDESKARASGSERPRGLLCYLDEMNSWTQKLTNRASGEDRSAWVVGFEAERYEMDRVQDGSTHADNFAVSIYGNMQPQVLEDNFSDLAQDGLLQRFLPAVLRHNKTRWASRYPTS